MRRLTAFLAAAAAALIFAVSPSALDENLLGDYSTVLWENAQLVYNLEHGTLAFSEGTGEAWVDFPIGEALALWFYADCGGYSGKGGGAVGVVFLAEDGGIVSEYEVLFSSDGHFYRYQLGTEDGFIPVPDGAKSVRAVLKSDGEESAYFRNLNLTLSRKAGRSEGADWVQSGKLQSVQVKTTSAHYWFWVVLVAVIPIIMFVLKKMQEKAREVK